MSSSTSTSNLFVDLARFGKTGEWEKAIKVADKILSEFPEEVKAFQSKLVCLIHLGRFQDSLNAIGKNQKLAGEVVFERAYCLYRLNKVNEALQVIQTISNPNAKLKELKAQVLYRLEKYEDCFDAYRDLIKNSQDDYEEERETNLSAVVSNLHSSGKKSKDIPQTRDHTYELCYNASCALLMQKKYKEALQKLKVTEDLCRKSLEEEEVGEDEIESELAIIRVQQGYTYQMLKQTEQALKLYNMVVKQKPADIGLVAVASNNIVSINKDQNVFDSKKRIKSATGEGIEYKLTSQQQQQIAINACLLLMHTNQIEQCRSQLKQLRAKYPNSAEAVLILAAIHCREKQVNKAVSVLREYVEQHPNLNQVVRLTQAQLLLVQGHINQACDVLRAINDVSCRLGIVSALVTLYTSLEDRDSATQVLNEALGWYKQYKPKAAELMSLWHECANFHLRNNQTLMAIECLEELRRNKPKDMKTLAQLITAYSQVNPKKAKDISKELPPVAEVSQNIDVDSLETSSWILGAKYVKKVGKMEPSPAVSRSGKSNEEIVKKKRKKKKGQLPKNYDPSVDPDPERWLPRRERSTYKKRKDKRGGGGIGKGTQGATSSSVEIDVGKVNANSPRSGTSATPPSVSSPSPAAQGPRQQRPQGGQKKKKKKGAKW